jgi:hypothetical protein
MGGVERCQPMTLPPPVLLKPIDRKRVLERRPTAPLKRRAGIRFGYLIRQLLDDGWKASEIAEATQVDRGLITTWHRRVTDPTYTHDGSRNGISDQTIQGIHDGLGVQANYLFMDAKGYPKTVRLADGSERPCEPDEVDHKHFKVAYIEEAREKRDNAAITKRQDAQDIRMDGIESKLDRLTELVLAALPKSPSEDTSKRNRG